MVPGRFWRGGAFGDALYIEIYGWFFRVAMGWTASCCAAVSCSSFGSERTNIIEKQIEKLLLGIRYHQKLLFFFVFHNGSRHSADDLVETEIARGLFG